VYTHFVTRSLRHPGDELHIVSPVYTNFITLCTSSPGWRTAMHFVTWVTKWRSFDTTVGVCEIVVIIKNDVYVMLCDIKW